MNKKILNYLEFPMFELGLTIAFTVFCFLIGNLWPLLIVIPVLLMLKHTYKIDKELTEKMESVMYSTEFSVEMRLSEIKKEMDERMTVVVINVMGKISIVLMVILMVSKILLSIYGIWG